MRGENTGILPEYHDSQDVPGDAQGADQGDGEPLQEEGRHQGQVGVAALVLTVCHWKHSGYLLGSDSTCCCFNVKCKSQIRYSLSHIYCYVFVLYPSILSFM